MKFSIALIIQIKVLNLISAGNVDSKTDLDSSLEVAKRVKRAQPSRAKCVQPPITPDKIYSVKLSLKQEANKAKPGETVPENAIIVSRCNEGYAFDYENEEYELPSICSSQLWQPPVLECKRTCKNFANILNLETTCYQYLGGPKISCTGLMLEGAIVKPRCRKKFRPNTNVNYDYATCREDGTWDKKLFKCTPECGQVASSSVSLIAEGDREKRGGAPWNLAFYSAERTPQAPAFICGGTLINAELVISAAHCFYDEVYHQKVKVGFFYAIVGKATPDYNKLDYPTTKKYTLKNIYFPEDITFEGANTNYAGDIVVVRLSDKVTFSSDVFPACLHWDERDRFNPGENVMGKLSGFGAKTDGTFPGELLTANLPFISYGVCKNKVRNDFRTSISTDKFCAGSEKESGARKGDSGGGLLFMDHETELYHLRGVVSNKDLGESSIATFTDIAQYISWIIKVIKTIENEYKSCGCNPSGSLGSTCDSKIGTCQCKAFVTGKKCDTCKDGYWQLQADNANGCVACECNSKGSHSSTCDKIDGSCQCKPTIIGRQCDKCADDEKVFGSNGCEITATPKWTKFSNGEVCSNAVHVAPEEYEDYIKIIVRVPTNELPVGAVREVPTYKLASIPLLGGHRPYSVYEVLCGGLVKWVKSEQSPVPEGAVVSRVVEKRNGKGPYLETYYVCKSFTGHGLLYYPGELYPNGSCIIHFRGERRISRDQVYFHTLRHTNKTGNAKWVKYSNGNRCSNAVPVGFQGHSPYFVVRRQINDSFESGKLIKNYKFTVIPESEDERERDIESERHFTEYEVLCADSVDWELSKRPEVPAKAVISRSVDIFHTRGFYTMNYHICRAVADDGRTYVGERPTYGEHCTISVEGNRIMRYPGEFEFLVENEAAG